MRQLTINVESIRSSRSCSLVSYLPTSFWRFFDVDSAIEYLIVSSRRKPSYPGSCLTQSRRSHAFGLQDPEHRRLRSAQVRRELDINRRVTASSTHVLLTGRLQQYCKRHSWSSRVRIKRDESPLATVSDRFRPFPT